MTISATCRFLIHWFLYGCFYCISCWCEHIRDVHWQYNLFQGRKKTVDYYLLCKSFKILTFLNYSIFKETKVWERYFRQQEILLVLWRHHTSKKLTGKRFEREFWWYWFCKGIANWKCIHLVTSLSTLAMLALICSLWFWSLEWLNNRERERAAWSQSKQKCYMRRLHWPIQGIIWLIDI